MKLLFVVLVWLVVGSGGVWAQSGGGAGGCTWAPCAPAVPTGPNSVLQTDSASRLFFAPLQGQSVPSPTTQCVSSAIAGGTGDALTVPKLPCVPTTTLLQLQITSTNTTATPTLQPTGGLAQIIKQFDGSPVSVGGLLSGSRVLLNNNGTNWFLVAPGISIGSIIGTAAAANNSALKALPSAAAGQVVLRLGFNSPGDGGAANYVFSSANCSLNSGAGDNGSQVEPSIGGGCWLLGKETNSNVLIWGADPSGAVDSTSAIEAADAAAATIGTTVYFPSGVYKVSTCLTPSTNAQWYGDTGPKTYLSSNSASNCIVDSANNWNTLRDLGFTSSVTRTSGAFVVVSGHNETLHNLVMTQAFTGITFNNNANIIDLDNVQVYPIAGGDGVVVNFCFGCGARRLYVQSQTGAAAASSLKITNDGDFSCVDCQLIAAQKNLEIVPGTGQAVVSLKWTAGFIDSATDTNLYIAPTGTGAVARSNFDGVWFGSGVNNNVNIVPGVSAIADGITFSNCEALGSTSGAGLAISAPAANIMWQGGKIAGNNVGVFVSGATHVGIADTVIGQAGGFSGNTTGISTGNSTTPSQLGDYIDIHDVQGLQTNPTPVAFLAGGSHNLIHDNPGYNPTGIIGVTPTSSPFTYTNALFASTVCGYGGNVTSVVTQTVAVVNAVGAGAWCVAIAANQSLTITYSSVPTVNAIQR